MFDPRVPIHRVGHIEPEVGSSRGYDFVMRQSTETKYSGNTVSLEVEMASLGDARSQQSLTTGVLGAFHRMLLSSSKG